MAQYVIFLAAYPFALAAAILAIFLPRLAHSYDRFAWLKLFNYLQLGFLIVNLAELLAHDPTLKQGLAAIDYIFIGSVPSACLLFSLEYTGIVRHFRPWQALLFVMPLLACCFGLANGSHGLVWRDLRFVDVGWIRAMESGGYGPIALAVFAQCYSFIVISSFIIAQHTVHAHILFRRQGSWLLLGVIFPLCSNLAFILRMVPGWNKDYSSLTLALGGLCLSIGCLRAKLLTVVPVSRAALFQQMNLGMIVTDVHGIIVDLNHAACRMLGRSEIALLGSPCDPVVEGLPPRFELSRNPLRSPEGLIQGWQLALRESDAERAAPAVGFSGEAGFEEASFLSLGELRVVEMLARNLSNKEIADRLGVSVNTVKFHLSNAFAKTGSHNRAELVHRIGDILNARTDRAPRNLPRVRDAASDTSIG